MSRPREKNCSSFLKYFIREYNEDLTDKIRSGRQMDTTLALSVKDFYLTENTVETLNYEELNDMIMTQQMRGDANVKFALIEKNTRLALPFSAFILTIMGVALSSKKRRGGIGWNIGIGIALVGHAGSSSVHDHFYKIFSGHWQRLIIFTDLIHIGPVFKVMVSSAYLIAKLLVKSSRCLILIS